MKILMYGKTVASIILKFKILEAMIAIGIMPTGIHAVTGILRNSLQLMTAALAMAVKATVQKHKQPLILEVMTVLGITLIQDHVEIGMTMISMEQIAVLVVEVTLSHLMRNLLQTHEIVHKLI